MLKRLLVFTLAALFALPLAAGNFAGTISPAGYSPPPDVFVRWCRFGRDCRSFPLNPGVPFTNEQDLRQKLGRYAGGDLSVAGMESYPAVFGEAKGGEVYEILKTLFREAGLLREPTLAELCDFAFSNFSRALVTCADFLQVIGRPFPGCSTVVSDDSLPLKPSEPPGCGRRALPCPLEMGLVPGEVRHIPARTSIGGRVGMFAIQPARATVPVHPIPPQPPVIPPTQPPSPVAPPPAPRRCVLVIFQEGVPPSAIEAACPP